jgi:hypothetical protein
MDSLSSCSPQLHTLSAARCARASLALNELFGSQGFYAWLAANYLAPSPDEALSLAPAADGDADGSVGIIDLGGEGLPHPPARERETSVCSHSNQS